VKPSTPESREDLILQVLHKHPDGIGFNQLQTETEMTRKTLHKYVNQMKEDKKINIKKLGRKQNSQLVITVNFSPKTKDILKRNFETATKYHWTRYGSKTQKVNVLPHYLQILASVYFTSMIHYLFDDTPSYKFIINRLEEALERERQLMDKEFSEINLQRIYESCHHIDFEMWTNASSAMGDAAMRKGHRTQDEISIDGADHGFMYEGDFWGDEPEEYEKDPMFVVDGSRLDLIKDPETKEKFKRLAKEYNETTQKLSDLRIQMMVISGMLPFEKAHPKISKSNKSEPKIPIFTVSEEQLRKLGILPPENQEISD